MIPECYSWFTFVGSLLAEPLGEVHIIAIKHLIASEMVQRLQQSASAFHAQLEVDEPF